MSPQWPKLSDIYVKADFTVKKKNYIFICVFEKQTDRHGWRQRERKRKSPCVCLWRLKEGSRFLGARVTSGCEWPSVGGC